MSNQQFLQNKLNRYYLAFRRADRIAKSQENNQRKYLLSNALIGWE